jgi:hypothetical protein
LKLDCCMAICFSYASIAISRIACSNQAGRAPVCELGVGAYQHLTHRLVPYLLVVQAILLFAMLPYLAYNKQMAIHTPAAGPWSFKIAWSTSNGASAHMCDSLHR